MTGKSKKAKAAAKPSEDKLSVSFEPGKSDERCRSDIALDPAAHGMAATRFFNKGSFGDLDTTSLFESHRDKAFTASAGDLSHQKMMLAAQADALNSMFTELSRRAALNMGEYLGATETYMRLGLKAQAQCRATIEALDSLTSGRVQTVKHVHVNDGAQAIVADQFHQHNGGRKNGKSNEQPHATGTAGEGAAMLGANSQGNGVPIPCGEGQEKVPYARRQRKRRAKGQS